MDLWNVKNLPIPPIDTYKAVDTNIDIKHLKNVFQDGKKFLDDEHHMSAEYAVMSTIIYRTKQKFRNSKDFKALVKIHRALGNYLKTNLSSDLKSFIELIPFRYKNETYLPNKNILDYILVRLQGSVKLLERIVDSCKITAYLLEVRMYTGHCWKIGFIIFSIVSRLYVLAKYNAKYICEFYSKVFPFSHQLKNSGRNWLPENYVLPTDLKKWMNVDWLDIDDELEIIEPLELSRITQYFDLKDDDDDIEFCDEYVMVEDEEEFDFTSSFKSRNKKQNLNFMRGFCMDEDVGEVIEIDDSFLRNENGPLQDVGEVVEIDDTLILSQNDSFKIDPCGNFTAKENSVDLGEVIEANNNKYNSLCNPLPFRENENRCESLYCSNGSNTCETNQSVSILDDSARCDIQNNITELNEVVEILDTPKTYKKTCQKPGKRRQRIKMKELNKINNIEMSKKLSKNSVTGKASAQSDSENVVEILDTPIKYRKTCQKPEKRQRMKMKELNKIDNNIETSKKSSKNSVTGKASAQSDSENVIVLTDTSLLHDDVIKTRAKKRRLQRQKAKERLNNSALEQNTTNLNSSTSDIFTNTTGVTQLCSQEKNKKKNKKIKTDHQNPMSLEQVPSDFKCSLSIKREPDEIAETSNKRSKTTYHANKLEEIHIKDFLSIKREPDEIAETSNKKTKTTYANESEEIHIKDFLSIKRECNEIGETSHKQIKPTYRANESQVIHINEEETVMHNYFISAKPQNSDTIEVPQYTVGRTLKACRADKKRTEKFKKKMLQLSKNAQQSSDLQKILHNTCKLKADTPKKKKKRRSFNRKIIGSS